MAALSRMATGMHRKVSITPNDVVVMSSHPIPGNERAVDRVVNELCKLHAKVIMQDTHVSGHACAEDIKLLYSLVKPKYAVPSMENSIIEDRRLCWRNLLVWIRTSA